MAGLVLLAIAVAMPPAAAGLGGHGVASAAAVTGTCGTGDDTCGANCGTGDQATNCGDPLVRHNDRVQHHPLVYIVAWGSGWANDTHALPQNVHDFIGHLAGTQWNNILSLYSDGTDYVHNDVAVGASVYYDTKNVVPFVMTMTDIDTEALKAVAANPTWKITNDTQVLVMPQQGSTYATSSTLEPWVAISGCGRHQLTNDSRVTASVLIYAGDGPCGAVGADDTTIKQYYTLIASHEYAEAATDPTGPGYPGFVPNWGWSTVNPTGDPIEVGDECQGWSFPNTSDPHMPGTWDPQRLWDRTRGACVQAVGQEFPSPDTTSPYTGVHTVQGAILGTYTSLGTTSSVLGEPITEEQPAPGGGRETAFSGSSCGSGSAILWTGSTGAWEMHGCIYNDFLHNNGLGGPAGQFGYPVSNEQETPSNDGRVNYMDGSPCGSGQAEPHSALYFNGTTWGVKGCIFVKYRALGETTSGLGYPTSGEYSVSGGIRQDFQYGYILWANNVATPHFSGPALTLRSAANGDYVSAELGFTGNAADQLRARSATQGPWESWSEYPVGNGQVALMSNANGLFVSAEVGWTGNDYGKLRARSASVGPWEKFQIVNNADGTYSLKSAANGEYVSAELGWTGNDYGDLRARSASVGPWEEFTTSTGTIGCTDYGGTTITGPNACSGFSRTGTWFPGGGVGLDGQEIWTYANGTVKDSTANYHLTGLGTTKFYQLYAYIPNNHSSAGNAHYHYCNIDTSTQTNVCNDGYVNQNNYTNQWAYFGGVCTANGVVDITLADDGGDAYPAEVGADAIKATATTITC